MPETRLFEAFAAQPAWAESELAQHLATTPAALRMLLADLHTRGILRVAESADGLIHRPNCLMPPTCALPARRLPSTSMS